ncbi:uncharacterized protein LOC101786811 isoform X2 [Setaria italica]|uniref:uncharacterized protein LOC101786811 isoform X2 n=1 Tax=Setaria italica TaxID=4555 RepID=UPI000BE521DC|nr:uncharacterized protein LOC101786811 isoform X2 [Setaria italica]
MLLLHHHRVVDLDLKCKRLLLLVLLRARVLALASDSPTAPSDSTTPGTINDDLKKGTTAMKGSQSTFVAALMTCPDEEDEDMDEPESTVVD